MQQYRFPDDYDAEARGSPLPEATADVLREGFAAYRRRHTFGAGDLVVFKWQFCPFKSHLQDQPMVFVESNLDRWGVVDDVAMPLADCVVMCRVLKGGVLHFMAADSAALEPWPRMRAGPESEP